MPRVAHSFHLFLFPCVLILVISGMRPCVANTRSLGADFGFRQLENSALRRLFIEQSRFNTDHVALDPVSILLGEQLHQETDLLLGGPLPIGFLRDYGVFNGSNSELHTFYFASDSPMGANWVHNYQFLLRRLSQDRIAIHFRRAKALVFDRIAGRWTLTQPAGFRLYRGTPYQLIETSSRGSGSYLDLMDPVTSHIIRFDAQELQIGDVRRALSYRDRSGNTHSLVYTNDNLTSVNDGLGRTLTISYVLSGGAPRIASVSSQDGRSIQYEYDGVDLERATNARGETTVYDYQTPGTGILVPSMLRTITRPRGNSPVQNTFDEAARVLTQRDGAGNTTNFTYGGERNTVTDPYGQSRAYVFDAQARITQFIDEVGNAVTYGYDSSDRRVNVTDREGATSTLTYHAESGKVTSRTNNLGNTWTYDYEKQEQEGFDFYVLTRISYPDGSEVRIDYDGVGRPIRVTNPEGNVATATYDSRGLLLTRAVAGGATESFTYTAAGNLATHEGAAGSITSYEYDLSLRLSALVRSDGRRVELAWDAGDNLVSYEDEEGNRTAFAYDSNDNLTSITDPLGNQTTYSYDGNDDLVGSINPLGKTRGVSRDDLRRIRSFTDRTGRITDFDYDTRRRPSSITDPFGSTSQLAHDDEGGPASLTDSTGVETRFTSDMQGRLVAIVSALGHSRGLGYDPTGMLSELFDEAGEITRATRDDRGLVTALNLPDGRRFEIDRGEQGEALAVRDPRDNETLRTYDAAGLVLSSTDPLGRTTTIGYDDRQRVADVTFADGASLSLEYDGRGLTTKNRFSGGRVQEASYDENGRLIELGGLDFAYREDGVLVESNGSLLERDGEGRLHSLTLASGFEVTYGYDTRGALEVVQSSTGMSMSLHRDAAGRLLRLERSNNIDTHYAYDAAGRLIEIEERRRTRGTGATISRILMTRDATGRIVETERTGALGVSLPSSLDNFSYDDADQVLGMVWDERGRRRVDAQRTYFWSTANELYSVEKRSQRSASFYSYVYDPLGYLTIESDGSTTREFRYLYGLGRPILVETNLGGTLERSFVPLPTGEVVGSANGNDASFYHLDEYGTIALISDRNGNIVFERKRADPLGRTTGESGSAPAAIERILFNAFGDLETSSGLVYAGGRWWDSSSVPLLTGFDLGASLFDEVDDAAAQSPVFGERTGVGPQHTSFRAEYGRIDGCVSNSISKSLGPEFSSSISYCNCVETFVRRPYFHRNGCPLDGIDHSRDAKMSGYDLPLEAPTTIGTSIDRAPLWLFETDDFSKDDFSKELSNDGPPPSSPWLRHDWSAVLSNLETRPSVDFLFNDPASEPAASTPSDGQPTFRGQFGFGPWRTVKPPTPENWRLLDLERLPSQLEELIL